jgi:hypothetical protein
MAPKIPYSPSAGFNQPKPEIVKPPIKTVSPPKGT